MEKAKIWCSLGLIFISLCTVIFLIFLYKKYSDYRHRDLYSYVDANPLDYWKNERSYSAAIMLDKGDIDEINARINSKMIKINEDKGVPGELATYNLLDYRTRLSRETIVDMIKITADKFFENIPDDSYYNFNSLLEENEISYAIAVEKSDIRTIPTDIHTFCSKDVDLTQGTSIRFGEPLIVIHKTADNLWSFVRTYNVMGWIRTKNIAAVSRDEFANYINMAKFLVVISKNELISGKYLDMGAKLELDGESEKFYSVKFPVRDKNGFIYYQKLELEKKPGLHRGYLDYSEKNIVEQAMKYYETPYVWGSADNGVDCSGLVLNVYSAFGFKLPRNSSTQQAAAGNVRFFSGSYRIMKINRVLDRTKAGSIIFFPGHIMLYLGKVANKHYAIHALLKCKKSGGRGKYEEYYPKQVIISALEDLERIKNGTSFIASLVSVTTIE